MLKRWTVVIGAALILLGMITIGNNILRAIGFNYRIGWIFWPIVLIGLGIWVIQGFTVGGWKGGEVPREDASIPLDGAAEASIRVKNGAGRRKALR